MNEPHNKGTRMLSFLRKCIIPAVVAAGLAGFTTIPMARAEDKPAAGAEVKKGTITGTLLDKDGKPVASAEIGVFKPMGRGGPGGGAAPAGRAARNGGKNGAVAQAEDPKPAPPADAGRGNRQRPEALFKTTTDADGKFTIKDVPVGEYALMARVDGKGFARERVTVKPDDSVTVSLKLADRPARGGGQGNGQ
jgi:hypothetical protein